MRGRLYRTVSGVLLAFAMSTVAADSVEMNDRLQLADGLFRRGLFELAAREYAALVETPDVPGLESVLFRLGECYRRTGKDAEAEESYKRLTEEYPNNPNASRAYLQRALILLKKDGAELTKAAEFFERLTGETMPPEVRSAASYHLGEALERLNRPDEALARYEELAKTFGESDYGMYAKLRIAWLLSKTNKPENTRHAMGIYLDLAYKAKDPKVAEEGFFFAAQLSLLDERFDESANLLRC